MLLFRERFFAELVWTGDKFEECPDRSLLYVVLERLTINEAGLSRLEQRTELGVVCGRGPNFESFKC